MKNITEELFSLRLASEVAREELIESFGKLLDTKFLEIEKRLKRLEEANTAIRLLIKSNLI